MRDLIIVGLCVYGSLMALRRPWIGVLVWTWLSLMNPHRYAWGFAYDAPLAAMSAASTLLGLLGTRDRHWPLDNTPTRWFSLFMAWITISWLAGLSPEADYEQWNKIMKIDLMILVAIALIASKQQILGLTWVAAGSLALLGVKGGAFTVMTGGSYRVWGPPGSFIDGNNEFALALAITIPLMRFLQMQLQSKWGRHAMTLAMVLCAAAALGSHSRGGLLAVSSMGLLMWWRGKNRVAGGIVIVLIAFALVAFMPDEWGNRMQTIETYQEDRSAMGRIAAWSLAWNLSLHHLFGVGFNAARPELFQAYSAYGLEYGTPVAHSIYFQVLGHHGLIGLAIFLAMWMVTYRWAGRLRAEGALQGETRWVSDLGAMCQVSLVGYAVGGAFLSLAYFDLPYIVLVLVVAARAWLAQRRWQTEVYPARSLWTRLPGLQGPGDGVSEIQTVPAVGDKALSAARERTS